MGAAGEMVLGAKPGDVSPWDPHMMGITHCTILFFNPHTCALPSRQTNVHLEGEHDSPWEWVSRSSALCIIEGQDSIYSASSVVKASSVFDRGYS